MMPTESQNIEFKESWRDEYQNGFVALPMHKAVRCILVYVIMARCAACRMPRS